jgi:hypothetical protein
LIVFGAGVLLAVVAFLLELCGKWKLK